MGQQCCTEDKADNRVYHANSKLQKTEPENFNLQNSNIAIDYQGIGQEYQIIKNFASVESVPKAHPNVIEIEEKLRPFQPSSQFQLPKGTPEESAFAINNIGLIYDANSEWQDGLPHGKGRLLYPDGSCFVGSFIKGVPSGQGRFISSQGWYYEGELFKQQAQGKGVFAFESIGYRYEGQWEGDLPNGKGRQTWTRPGFIASYEGQYVGGQKHGKGKYKSGDEWQYEGEFSNNELTSARGLMKYKNGEIYEGGFMNGKKHGFGIYTWKDGSTYEGWYANDKKEGHGKFVTRDGKRFEGQWVDGKREGRGVLIVGGKKYPGQWKNDLPSSSKNL